MEQSQIEKNGYRRNGIEIKARWNGIVLDRKEQREMEWNRSGKNLIELDNMEQSWME